MHGNLAYAWDAGDTAARRFAAVSLMRIKAATQLEVAEAFAVKPATVRRWETRLADAGVAGLLAERKGPKRKSKLTGDTVAAIRRLREGGASYRGDRRRHRGVGGQCPQRAHATPTPRSLAPQRVLMLTCRRNRRARVEPGVEIEVRRREGLPGNDFGCAGHRHWRCCGGGCGAGVGRSGDRVAPSARWRGSG